MYGATRVFPVGEGKDNVAGFNVKAVTVLGHGCPRGNQGARSAVTAY